LYGEVVTRPAQQWPLLSTTQSVLVDPSLLISLDAEIGDTLSLGFARFVIGGVIEQIPGDPGVAAAIGPRVFIASRWVEATRLLTFGSRAEYEAVVQLPTGVAPGRWIAPLRPQLRANEVRVRTV